MEALNPRIREMLKMQSELRQIYFEQQLKKKKAHNEDIIAKKYYGNSTEYWNEWRYLKQRKPE